ncbi:unnamed protein product, partial [Bacillus phage SPP1]
LACTGFPSVSRSRPCPYRGLLRLPIPPPCFVRAIPEPFATLDHPLCRLCHLMNVTPPVIYNYLIKNVLV